MRLYAAALVAGVAVGVLTHAGFAPLFGPLTLAVFVPALIFEAAWTVDYDLMRANARPIVLLAVPGVVLTAAVIAAAVHFAGLPWRPALALGALLSATDPIAVVAIFRRLHVPPALATIVESESLLNDAMAVVLFRAVLTGAAVAAAIGVAVSVAGAIAFAWIVSFALRRAVTAPLQIAATIAGAYGICLLSDRFGGSGIFAAVAFGIALRRFETRRLSVECNDGVRSFWRTAANAANIVLFFLLGAAVDARNVPHAALIMTVTAAAVVIARVLLAYGVLQFARKYVTRAWMHVVRMAGVRGALSVALALSLPATLAQRGQLISATFAVAVATMLLGMVTYRRRLSRMKI